MTRVLNISCTLQRLKKSQYYMKNYDKMKYPEKGNDNKIK